MKNKFRERRQYLGLTGLDVALKVGVREGTYLKWERGETIPSSQYVVSLEKALQTKWRDLWMED